MKIENNYDIISKINELEFGYDIKKQALRNLKISGFIYSIFAIADIVQNDFKFINTLIGYGTCNVIMNTLDLISYGKILKSHGQYRANNDLVELIFKLKILNIKTSIELLKEAEVTHTNYRLTINKNKLPIIQQKKYILIPTYNEYSGKDEVSLLQEHNLGSKKYVLSIGSPKKKTSHKLAYNV